MRNNTNCISLTLFIFSGYAAPMIREEITYE